MRILSKLLIGFLSCASIGSGIITYNNQIADSQKTSVEYTKEAEDSNTATDNIIAEESTIENKDLSKAETDATNESPAQVPDTVMENQDSQTIDQETVGQDKTTIIPQDNTQPQNDSTNNVPVSNSPEAKAPETSTPPAPSTPPANTPTPSIPPASTPAESAPAENTTPDPAPTQETGNVSFNSGYADQVLTLLNQERAKAGLAPLTMNQGAINAANVRAKEIVSSFSHTRPNGQSPFTALNEAGVSYRASGENIACGQDTPSEVMTGWMNSSGHRANILNSNFTQVGIACFEDPNSTYGYYWVQLFIG